MKTGAGTAYREPSTLERLASGIGRSIPASARGPLRGLFDRTLGLFDRRLISTLPGGERIVLTPPYRHLTWNAEEYAAFRQDVRAGDVVLDIGANQGAYTLLFAMWVGAAGRVHAFEPSPASFDALCTLLDANALTQRVTTVRAAIAALEGDVHFAARSTDGANRITHDAHAPGVTTVAATTIDAVCRESRISPRLIKIDVEGAELEALRGARQTIAAGRGRLRLYVEMHPHLWPEFGVTRRDLETEFVAQGLRAERLDGAPDIWNVEGICLRLVPCGS